MTTFMRFIFVCMLVHLCFAQTTQTTQTTQITLTTSQAWGFGFLTGFALSLVGFVAAILVVLARKCIVEQKFTIFVNTLYALGCGAIVGDAMIHILPEAFSSEQTNTRYVSLIFICAIGFFIIIERIFESCGIVHQHWGDEKNHGHLISPQIDYSPTKKIDPNNQTNQNPGSNIIVTSNLIPDTIQQKKSETSEGKTCIQNLKGKKSAGYLNLLSSLVHNFFDGFAIGVGFASQDKGVYIPVVIAIFAHQIPRQIGDVGILMKSQFSSMQTVLCNGFINFMSLFGVLAGLGLGGIDEAAENYVLVFIAGNFIYIGSDIWKHLLRNKNVALNILEAVVFSIGVGAMFLILLAES